MQQQQQYQVNVPQNIGGPSFMPPPSTAVMAVGPTVVKSYNSQQSIALGVTLIVCAVLSFVFNIVDLAVGLSNNDATWGVIGHGFWVGVMSLIAGGFGVGAGRSKTKCQIIAFNVLCILTAVFTIAQFTVGWLAVYIEIGHHCYYYYNYACMSNLQTTKAMEIMLVILAAVEAVTAIWGSVMCCKTHCCCCPTIPVNSEIVCPANSAPVMVVWNSQAAGPAFLPANCPPYAPSTPFMSQMPQGNLPVYMSMPSTVIASPQQQQQQQQQQQAAGFCNQVQNEPINCTNYADGSHKDDVKLWPKA